MARSKSCRPNDPARLARAAASRRSGVAAEEAAVRFLRRQGAHVLLRNYRRRCGELDIVARCGDELAIVEVRSRASMAFGGAAASVGSGKRRRMLRAAAQLLQERPKWAGMRIRFDVLALTGPLTAQPRIEWIKHAFALGERGGGRI